MDIDGAVAVTGLGLGGGLIAELLHWWKLREAKKLPTYASSPIYWAITGAMVLASGFVTWLYFGEHANGLMALHVGISTPLILQKFATTIPRPGGGKNIIAPPKFNWRDFFTW